MRFRSLLGSSRFRLCKYQSLFRSVWMSLSSVRRESRQRCDDDVQEGDECGGDE